MTHHIGLRLSGCAAVLLMMSGCAFDVPSEESATSSALRGVYEISVSIEPGGGPGLYEDESPLPLRFASIPPRIRFNAESSTRLAPTETGRFASSLTVQTTGASECVQLFATTRTGETTQISFPIVDRGAQNDPCTGNALGDSALDLTTEGPEPLAWMHTYWKLSCDPRPCHWIKVRCHHNEGID
ncbi:MAG: hypothetical protein AAGF12_12595 [Myxococcota bacterium]